MDSLLEPKSWTGEFFHPEFYENRFSGTLAYSPDGGVILTYRIVGYDKVPSTSTLHGVLNTGEMCTLFGEFPTTGFGFSIKNGLYSSEGKCGFRFLAVGSFLPEEFRVDDIRLTVSSLESFLGSEHQFGEVSLAPMVVQSAALSFGSFELVKSASFDLFPANVNAAIHSLDENALSDLVTAFAEVRERHPEAYFFGKKSLENGFRLRLNTPTRLLDAWRHVSDICGLFALLMGSPVYPVKLSARDPSQSNPSGEVQIYPALRLNPPTVKLACRRTSHFTLPLSASDLDFAGVAAAWLDSATKNSALISAIQHEVGFRTHHSAQGDIVLYSSQLESIAHAAGKRREKYEYPVDRYGTAKLRLVLEGILKVQGSSAIGRAIAGVRNEIVHVGKPQKYLSQLSLKDLMKVGQCVKLVVAAFTLESVGITESLTSKYVDAFLQRAD
jgi:hypothetical protein